MIIKKYIVSNMNEALSMIKNELGKEAVIVSKRKIRRKGVKGILLPKLLEVTAAVENSRRVKNTKVEEKEFEDSINSIRKLMDENLREKKEEKSVEKKGIEQDDVEKIKYEINGIKEMLNKALKNEEKEDFLENLVEELDLCKEIYSGKERREMNREETVKWLRKSIYDDLLIDTKDVKGKIALVGPTGVGKTTTIAKLAGKLALKDGKRVGLITVDTYRIGAVEQLKTYAEIMDIEFKVVLNTKEMEEAIDEMKDLDVVLIDSTGRSSKNVMQIKELNNLLGKANPDSIYLVLSATTKLKDLRNIIKGYKCFNYEKLILTKLDETTSYGVIYNVQKISQRPIRFLTTGQNVPDDIIDSSKEKILKLIFNGEDL